MPQVIFNISTKQEPGRLELECGSFSLYLIFGQRHLEIELTKIEKVTEIKMGVDEKDHGLLVISEDRFLVFLNTSD